MKSKELLGASPQKRILFEPKESTPSPVKSSPIKAPAYQQYLSLAESGTPALPLPYHYRFLAEAFRCVDTVYIYIKEMHMLLAHLFYMCNVFGSLGFGNAF